MLISVVDRLTLFPIANYNSNETASRVSEVGLVFVFGFVALDLDLW